MRHSPHHAVTDPAIVRRLIDEHPWATLVSVADGVPVASHYPVLLDERDDDRLAVVTHVGRPDDQVHDFGAREMLLIFAGPSGYVSPSWYGPLGVRAPTWNFSVAHCYGVPEILDPEENLRVLTRLVERFERHVDAPVLLDPEVGARLAPGTVGIRVPIARFTCKVKMSQDKDPQSRRQVLEALRRPGPYQHLALADDMQRALADPRTAGAGSPALLEWLTGEWSVDRDISDGRGTFRGGASFTPQDDGTLRWHEAGELTLDGSTLPAYRTLTIDADGQVRFDDGRPFHDLVLVDGACDAFHPCGADEYTGRYEVVDDDTLVVTWHVEGPRKHDVIVSRYTRLAAA